MKEIIHINIKLLFITVYLTVLIFFPVFSQQKVKVITKTITKEIKYNNQTININGEKSVIKITGWNNNYIHIEIKLISKNPVIELAKKDLNVLKYDIDQKKNNVFIKNYFNSEVFKNITSNLSTLYNIKVPVKCNTEILNIYGDVFINNISSTTNVKNSFGELHIINSTGKINTDLYYSNLIVNNFNGIFYSKSERSDLTITNASGSYTLETNYGKIYLTPGNNLQLIDINADRTTIDIQLTGLNKYNYSLKTRSSKIHVPLSLEKNIINERPFKKLELHNGDKPSIKIQTTYCPITLNLK